MNQEKYERAKSLLANNPGIWNEIPGEAKEFVDYLGTSIADDMDWEFAIDPQTFRYVWSDSEMLAYTGEDISLAQITDEIRLKHARSTLESSVEELQADEWLGVHALELKDDVGKFAYLCATSWLEGYTPKVSYIGVFSSKNGFLDHLRDCGMWLRGDVSGLTDGQLLTYWESD